MSTTVPHDPLKYLKDPEFAAQYILAFIEDGEPLYECLAHVIKAHGLANLARRSGIAAPNLLRATRKGANPTIATLQAILHALGMELSVVPLKKPTKRGRTRQKPKALAKAA
jgi:probable addiction module antidote protein